MKVEPRCETCRLVIRPFIVEVSGFSPTTYYGRSRGQALARAWREYCSYNETVKFGDFLKLARCYAGLGNAERFGEQITVGGETAFYVSHNRQYIQFVRPDSDVIMNSHPYDVEPPEARRGTPYYTPPCGEYQEAGDE